MCREQGMRGNGNNDVGRTRDATVSGTLTWKACCSSIRCSSPISMTTSSLPSTSLIWLLSFCRVASSRDFASKNGCFSTICISLSPVFESKCFMRCSRSGSSSLRTKSCSAASSLVLVSPSENRPSTVLRVVASQLASLRRSACEMESSWLVCQSDLPVPRWKSGRASARWRVSGRRAPARE